MAEPIKVIGRENYSVMLKKSSGEFYETGHLPEVVEVKGFK